MGVTNLDSLTLTNDLIVGDHVSVSGDLAVTGQVNPGSLKFPAAVAGVKTIAAASAGSGIVSTSQVTSSSIILLTVKSAITNPICWANVVATGSFKINLRQLSASGTVATASGQVSWLVATPT